MVKRHIKYDMMYSIQVTSDALKDLKNITASDPDAAAEILVILQEIGDKPDLIDRLNQDGYGVGDHTMFDVKMWRRQQDNGHPLWRARPGIDYEAGTSYRIFYALDSRTRIYRVLAIANRRDVNYDRSDNPFTQRILRACDEYGL